MKKTVIRYVVSTYVIFIVLLLITGCTLLFSDNSVLLGIMKNICSWAPTFSLLLLFPRLKIGMNRRAYIRSLFHEKVNVKNLIFIAGMQICLFAVTVIILQLCFGIEIHNCIQFSKGLLVYAFVNNFTSGAVGEEAGWRGFLHPMLVSKFGAIKGSFYLGIIWGFWHTPLWFITGEFTGIDLLRYIVFFLIYIVSTAIIIGLSYEKNRNLIVSMSIHFVANFMMTFVKSEVLLLFLTVIAIVYMLGAIALVYNYNVNLNKISIKSQ